MLECVADLNGDGIVNAADLLLFLQCTTGNPPACGDFDGDGAIAQPDWSVFLSQWNCPAVPPVEGGEIQHLVVPVSSVAGDADPQTAFLGGITHYTFDLRTDVTGDEDWTTTQAAAQVTGAGATIFQHPFGSDQSPFQELVELFPALQFDSHWTTPSDPDGLLVFDPTVTPVEATALWGDLLQDVALGGTIARYTFVVPEEAGVILDVVPAGGAPSRELVGTIAGTSTVSSQPAVLLPFAFDVVAIPTCAADVAGGGSDRGDGTVDVQDLVKVVLSWGPCPSGAAYCDGDVTGDEQVGVEDLVEVILNWGDCVP